MTDKKIEALKLALEAFEKLLAEKSYWWQEVEIDTVEALEKAESICKQALAKQPAQQQEPVAWLIDNDYTTVFRDIAVVHRNKGAKVEPLYTSPPASKPWVGLTDEEIQADFNYWWYREGSGPMFTTHDCEEHTKRMCEIAWKNGAYKAAHSIKENT